MASRGDAQALREAWQQDVKRLDAIAESAQGLKEAAANMGARQEVLNPAYPIPPVSTDPIPSNVLLRTLPSAVLDTIAARPGDLGEQVSNYAAGVGDTVSAGGTQKIRSLLDYDDVVDKSGDAYRYGGYTGQGINVSLMLANPVGAASNVSTWAKVGMYSVQGLGMGSGLVDAGQGALAGDPLAAGQGLLTVADAYLRVGPSPCKAATVVVGLAQRGVGVVSAGNQVVNGVDKLENEEYLGAALDFLQAGVTLMQLLSSCFASGTRLLTRTGSKAVEDFAVGDLLLSRSEHDAEGAVVERAVEEVFVRLGRVLHLHVGGEVIRTTGEHPFWVAGKGWVAAAGLRTGDELVGHDGRRMAVEELYDTGAYETVYNLRIAEYHTYFVGCDEWGFSVWAHNSYTALREEGLSNSQAKRANMLYKTQGEAAARAYLEGQGFSGSRLDTLANAAARQRTGAQRGPNDSSGQTETIRRVAREATANGDTVLAGGKMFDGVYRAEAEFDTPGGFKSSRRPDVLAQRPDGSIYGINVGETAASGRATRDELRAIQDLNEQVGLEMSFVGYRRRP